MDRREERESPPGYNTDLMSYYTLENRRLLKDTEEHTGVNTDAEVSYRPDGTRVYVKNADSRHDDIVQSHIAASIFGEHLHTLTPDIAYDDIYGKVMIEEMPGERVKRGLEDSEVDPFHRAVAEKMLMGDVDYSGNFLTTGRDVVPIDYDQTGRELTTARKTVETGTGGYLDDDLLNMKASEIANSIDLGELEDDLRNERYLDDSWVDEVESDDPAPWDELFIGSIDNILENVRAFQN